MTRHDRDIDRVARESAKQSIMATIDSAYIHIRKAPVVFNQRRVHVPRRRGGMNADRQQAKFAAAPALDPPEFRVHVIEYPLGARDELQPHHGEVGAAIRPFEQHYAKLALDLVQPAAQGRLAYVQSFRRLSQAAVL
jgi:hypothetical protein